jgi:hypothetical protein
VNSGDKDLDGYFAEATSVNYDVLILEAQNVVVTLSLMLSLDSVDCFGDAVNLMAELWDNPYDVQFEMLCAVLDWTQDRGYDLFITGGLAGAFNHVMAHYAQHFLGEDFDMGDPDDS